MLKNKLVNKLLLGATLAASLFLAGCKAPGLEQYYKVSYELNSDYSGVNAPSPLMVAGNTKITQSMLPSYTQKGYKFDGWYKGNSKSKKVYAGESVTSDLKLYAEFKKEAYHIYFYPNNGNTIPAISYYVTSETIQLPTDITRNGYTFDGWYDDKDFSGNTYTEVPAGSTGDKTFYAKWTPIIYNITYDLGESGSWAEGFVPVTTYTVEDTIVLPTASNVVNNKKILESWTLDGSSIDRPSISAGKTGDLILTAVWQDAVRITYDLNGGSWVANADYKTFVSKRRLSTELQNAKSLIQKTDSRIIKWVCSDESAIPTSTGDIPDEISVKPIWEEKITVQYQLREGASFGSFVPETRIYLDEVYSKIPSSSKVVCDDTCKFIEWTYKGEKITSSTKFEGPVVVIAAKMSFKANITFDLGDNASWRSGYTPISKEYTENIYSKLPSYYYVEIKDSSEFNGWTYKGEKITSSTVFTEENITITISYKEKFTITYDLRGMSFKDGYTPLAELTEGYRITDLPKKENINVEDVDSDLYDVVWYYNGKDVYNTTIKENITVVGKWHKDYILNPSDYTQGEFSAKLKEVKEELEKGLEAGYFTTDFSYKVISNYNKSFVSVLSNLGNTFLYDLRFPRIENFDGVFTNFDSKVKINSISIPNNATINANMFENCKYLKYIYEYNSLNNNYEIAAPAHIRASAFKGCSSLEILYFDNLQSLGESAFEDCGKLSSGLIPVILDIYGNIPAKAFKNCSSITGIEFGTRVSGIDLEAFYGCSGIRSITVKDDAKPIKEIYPYTDKTAWQSNNKNQSKGWVIYLKNELPPQVSWETYYQKLTNDLGSIKTKSQYYKIVW